MNNIEKRKKILDKIAKSNQLEKLAQDTIKQAENTSVDEAVHKLFETLVDNYVESSDDEI